METKKHRTTKTAEEIVGTYDLEFLKKYEQKFNPFAVPKSKGERDVHMGPVKKGNWPDDGVTHLEEGSFWAFGLTKQEALASPLLLLSFLICAFFAWGGTTYIAHQMGGRFGYLLGWVLFIILVIVARILLLNLTQLVFSFLETQIAAQNERKESNNNA